MASLLAPNEPASQRSHRPLPHSIDRLLRLDTNPCQTRSPLQLHLETFRLVPLRGLLSVPLPHCVESQRSILASTQRQFLCRRDLTTLRARQVAALGLKESVWKDRHNRSTARPGRLREL